MQKLLINYITYLYTIAGHHHSLQMLHPRFGARRLFELI